MEIIDADLPKVTAFLTAIGLPWRWEPGAHGFIPDVDIKDGVLLLDPKARASAVLHEAGHLATLPGKFRHLAQSDVAGAQKAMLKSVDFNDPDGPLQRAALQCSDPEATAWAWAAGVHLGLAAEAIIQDDEYENNGAFVRMQLQTRGYMGINGLAHAGFCVTKPGALAVARGLPAYPQLARWLQLDFSETAQAA